MVTCGRTVLRARAAGSSRRGDSIVDREDTPKAPVDGGSCGEGGSRADADAPPASAGQRSAKAGVSAGPLPLPSAGPPQTTLLIYLAAAE